jgi:hypothetical protein
MLPGTRYATLALRAGFALALLFGLGFWTGIITPAGGLVLVHMLLGLVVVVSVWYLGLAQAQHGGSLGLTLGTFVLGLLLPIVGLTQASLEAALHTTIATIGVQIFHVLLALATVGLGEMCGRRIRGAPASAPGATDTAK